jgi:general secretion pathway protein E
MSSSNVLKVREGLGLEDFEVIPGLVNLLPRNFSQKNLVIILGPFTEGEAIFVGALEPHNKILMNKISSILQTNIIPVQLNSYEIVKSLTQVFSIGSNKVSQDSQLRLKYRKQLTYKDKISISSLVEQIFEHAVSLRASDIHIESYDDDMDLRYRIDGILHGISCPITPENSKELISRIKVISGLEILNTRSAQDGMVRATFKDENRIDSEISFRLSIVPGIFGEDVVVRIQRSKSSINSLDQLGLGKYRTAQLQEILNNPEGLILTTGPTGSGKTTTLYSALNLLSKDSKKILTAEDPVEQVLENVNQKQINSHMGFSDYTKAFLRQDPDVILIGEIRDQETAKMSLRASQNGVLVLSSLHTPDAIKSLTRMYSLGVDWDLLMSGLLACLNQRLLRRICLHCKEEYQADEKTIKSLRLSKVKNSFFRGKGCVKCSNTGYLGRVAIYEMIVMNENIVRMLKGPEDIYSVKDYLLKNGHQTLFHDAIKKALRGEVTLEDIKRCVPYKTINF